MSVLSSNHSALSQETHSAYSAGTTSGKSLMELKSLLVNQQCADESMGLDQNRSLVVKIQKAPRPIAAVKPHCISHWQVTVD